MPLAIAILAPLLAVAAQTQAGPPPSPERQELSRRLMCQGLAINLGIKFALPSSPSAARLKAYEDAAAIVKPEVWGEKWPKGTQTMFAAMYPDKAKQQGIRYGINKHWDTVAEAQRIAEFNACLAKYPRT